MFGIKILLLVVPMLIAPPILVPGYAVVWYVLSGNVRLPSAPKLYTAPLALNHRSAVVCSTPLPLLAGSTLIVPSTPSVK